MKPDGTTDDSDDDLPLSKIYPKKRSKVKGDGSADGSDADVPLSKRERKTGSKVKGRARRKKIESDDEEEEQEVASKRKADFSITARTHPPRQKTTARNSGRVSPLFRQPFGTTSGRGRFDVVRNVRCHLGWS